MLWMITHDYIDAGALVGRGNVKKDATKVADGQEFRLSDDDGVVYFKGRCVGLDDASADAAFAPLDWAANMAGCTRMEVNHGGTWTVL